MQDIQIKKSKVLRYLGYRGQEIDRNIDELINQSIEEIKVKMEAKYIYKIFELDKKKGLSIKGTDLYLKGESIGRHLENSNSCILMASTLGHRVDKLIRYYEKLNMTKAIVVDSCASVAIEEVCNRINNELEGLMSGKGEFITSRFSPGYGDLTLDIQEKFVNLLNAQRLIGLTTTSSNLLIPRKSVTAIIGIAGKKHEKEKSNCLDCSQYKDCNFREGEFINGD